MVLTQVLRGKIIVAIAAFCTQIPLLAGCGPSSSPTVLLPNAQSPAAPPPSVPVRVEDLAGTLLTPCPIVLSLGGNWQPRDPAPAARFKGFAT